MIQPLNLPHVCSAKTRTGLQNISELLPRLIAQYELQARAQQQLQRDRTASANQRCPKTTWKQQTFAWYR